MSAASSVSEYGGDPNSVIESPRHETVPGSGIATDAIAAAEMLPSPSLAHAYALRVPSPAKVTCVGAEGSHPGSAGSGGVALSVITYPVTAASSVAVNVVTATVSVLELTGITNAVTTGAGPWLSLIVQ